ncbi:MAG: hypothetical protein N2485_02740 [bacterium]|nr:hypothetical protein [bacterium]
MNNINNTNFVNTLLGKTKTETLNNNNFINIKKIFGIEENTSIGATVDAVIIDESE